MASLSFYKPHDVNTSPFLHFWVLCYRMESYKSVRIWWLVPSILTTAIVSLKLSSTLYKCLMKPKELFHKNHSPKFVFKFLCTLLNSLCINIHACFHRMWDFSCESIEDLTFLEIVFGDSYKQMVCISSLCNALLRQTASYMFDFW